MKASEIVRAFIPAKLSVSRPCQLGRKLNGKRETQKKNLRRNTPTHLNK